MFTKISIIEKGFTNNRFKILINLESQNGNDEAFELELENPYVQKEEELFELYFEEFLRTPFENIRIKAVNQLIIDYGCRLFHQLFGNIPVEVFNGISYSDLTISIHEYSPAFGMLYWESMREDKNTLPLVIKGVIIRRINKSHINETLIPKSLFIKKINLLLVTARPDEGNDVNYRTVQRPLVQLIENSNFPINLHILRPGTFEKFVHHLMGKGPGYYHIVHFDLHGAVMNSTNYNALRSIALKLQPGLSKYLETSDKEDFKEQSKAFIFFESGLSNISVPVSSNELGNILQLAAVPIVILNACQSAKQSYFSYETNFAKDLVKSGISLVLAMRFSVSVSAVELFMASLYEAIFNNTPLNKAITIARKTIYERKKRQALYKYEIELEDWLLPIVYQGADMNAQVEQLQLDDQTLIDSTGAKAGLRNNEKESDIFIGRDFDVLKIEKSLLNKGNLLLVRGLSGIGKSALFEHLKHWWAKTGFITGSIYVDLRIYNQIELIVEKIFQDTLLVLKPTERLVLEEKTNIAVLVEILKIQRMAIFFDHADDIYSLSTAEEVEDDKVRKKIKVTLSFLFESLEGESPFVLIGARGFSFWQFNGYLKNKNTYTLRGLDDLSVSEAVYSITQKHQLQIEDYVNDPFFDRLINYLGGHIEAINTILPTLKFFTPKALFEAIIRGDEDLHQYLNEEWVTKMEQYVVQTSIKSEEFMHWLAPFIDVINLNPAVIKFYLDEFSQSTGPENNIEQRFSGFIADLIDAGVINAGENLQASSVCRLHPIFSYLLKKTYNSSLSRIDRIHGLYYAKITEVFSNLNDSKKPQQQQLGAALTKMEFENILKALQTRLHFGEHIFSLASTLNSFYSKKNQPSKSIDLFNFILDELEKNEPAKLGKHFSGDYILIIGVLMELYVALNQLDKAEQANKRMANFYEKDDYLKERFKQGVSILYENEGLIALQAGNYLEAKKLFEEALKLAEQFRDLSSQARIYQTLGGILSQLDQVGNFSESLQYFKRSLAYYIEQDDLLRQADVWTNLGISYSSMQNYEEAHACYQKALKGYKAFNDHKNIGKTLRNIGLLYAKERKNEEAKKNFLHALESYELAQDKGKQGLLFKELFRIAIAEEDSFLAEQYLEKSLEYVEEKADRLGIGILYYELGCVFLEQLKYEAAVEKLHQAQLFFEELSNVGYQMKNLKQLGAAYFQMGYYFKAKSVYEKGLELKNDFEGPNILVPVYLNLGIILLRQNAFVKVEEYFNIAHRLLEHTPLSSMMASVEMSYAFLNMAKKDYVQAENHYKRALKIFDHNRNESGKGLIYQSLSALKIDTRNFTQAESYLKLAKDIYKKHGKIEKKPWMNYLSGILSFHKRRFQDAELSFDKAIKQFGDMPNYFILGKIWNYKSRVSKEQRLFEKAEEGYEQSLSFHDKIEDNMGKAMILINKSNVLREKKAFLEAKNLLHEAEVLVKQLHDEPLMAFIHLNKAITAQKEKEFSKAVPLFYKSLELFKQYYVDYYQGEVYYHIGVSLFEEGQLESSKEKLLQSITFYNVDYDLYNMAKVYYHLALVEYELKNFNEARKFNDQSLIIFKKYEDKYQAAKTLGTHGKIECQEGSYSLGMMYFKKAVSDLLYLGEFEHVETILVIISTIEIGSDSKASIPFIVEQCEALGFTSETLKAIKKNM